MRVCVYIYIYIFVYAYVYIYILLLRITVLAYAGEQSLYLLLELALGGELYATYNKKAELQPLRGSPAEKINECNICCSSSIT